MSADSGSSLKGQKTIDEMKRWKGILMVVSSLVTPAVVPHSIEKEKEKDIFSVEPICALDYLVCIDESTPRESCVEGNETC